MSGVSWVTESLTFWGWCKDTLRSCWIWPLSYHHPWVLTQSILGAGSWYLQGPLRCTRLSTFLSRTILHLSLPPWLLPPLYIPCSFIITLNPPTTPVMACLLRLSGPLVHSFPFRLFSLPWLSRGSTWPPPGITRCPSLSTAFGVLPAGVHQPPLPPLPSSPRSLSFPITSRPAIILDNDSEPQDDTGFSPPPTWPLFSGRELKMFDFQ